MKNTIKTILKIIGLIILLIFLYIIAMLIFFVIYGEGGQASSAMNQGGLVVILIYTLPLIITGVITHQVFKKDIQRQIKQSREN
jgi:membrane protease YdiL (CAAX protease family)